MSSTGPAIGILGSAFNPPHLGHLALAQEAIWQLGLSEVIFVPTGEAPHKRIVDDPGRELRLAMTRLAAADDPRFSVSTCEVDREGPPIPLRPWNCWGGSAASRGWFSDGRRAAVGLESWHRCERVIVLALLAIAAAGVADAEVGAVLRSLDAVGRATMLEMPQFGVSSSAVRERAAAGRPLRYLVPEPVARFIEEKGIYSRRPPPEALARRLAQLADSKQADQIIVLDMRSTVAYTDFLAICTARNERHARAIVDEVRLRMKQEAGVLPIGVDGGGDAGWVVLGSSIASCTSSPLRRGSAISSRISRQAPRLQLERAPRASSAAGFRTPTRIPVRPAGIAPEMPSEGLHTVPGMGSFKRGFLGYRRHEWMRQFRHGSASGGAAGGHQSNLGRWWGSPSAARVSW